MKAKIDWSTLKMLGPLVPLARQRRGSRLRAVPPGPPPLDDAPLERVVSTRGNGSVVKLLLSGGASRARARGAIYTHAQLKRLLPSGPDMLVYSWDLVIAVLWQEHGDLSHGVELVARAIRAASDRLARRIGLLSG